MAINLFGFTIGREDKQSELKSQSFITPVSEDGTTTVSAGGISARTLILMHRLARRVS